MEPHLDPRRRRRKPLPARAGKFGETTASVLKAEVAAYHQTGQESNIPPATPAALKEKKKTFQAIFKLHHFIFGGSFSFFPASNLSTFQNTISSTTLLHINFSPGWFYVPFLRLNAPTLRLRFCFNTLLRLAAAIFWKACAEPKCPSLGTVASLVPLRWPWKATTAMTNANTEPQFDLKASTFGMGEGGVEELQGSNLFSQSGCSSGNKTGHWLYGFVRGFYRT